MQETQVPSLGGEDPLEMEMATHSSILAWEIPWTEEPGGLQSMGSQRVRHDLAMKPLNTTRNRYTSEPNQDQRNCPNKSSLNCHLTNQLT